MSHLWRRQKDVPALAVSPFGLGVRSRHTLSERGINARTI